MNQTLLNLLAHLKVPEFDQSVYLCLLDSKDNKNTELERIVAVIGIIFIMAKVDKLLEKLIK